jgi:AraC family transcriptional regulator
MIQCQRSTFCVEADVAPDFLPHVQWSAQPDVTVLETGSLPIFALRHHRTLTDGMVEVLADAPAAKDWDVLVVNRNGLGKLGIDFDGTHYERRLHRDLCCFFPAGADNRVQFGSDTGSFLLYLRPGVIGSLLESDGEVRGAGAFAPILGKQLPRVAHLMGLIESELRRPSLGSRLMVDGLLRAIAGLMATRDGAPEPTNHDRIYLSPPKLKRVMDFIEAHLQDSIGLEDLAEAAGLSANHFLRVFKLATGETPYHFLRNRRLERARQLLADDPMPLAQLALECGFANQAHFTAAFSRELGISPGRYRRAVRA